MSADTRNVRPFRELPLGTRIRYLSGGQVWAVIDATGCGLIAKWDGPSGPTFGQSICSVAESPSELSTMLVEVVE